jgi:hypothetical protein
VRLHYFNAAHLSTASSGWIGCSTANDYMQQPQLFPPDAERQHPIGIFIAVVLITELGANDGCLDGLSGQSIDLAQVRKQWRVRGAEGNPCAEGAQNKKQCRSPPEAGGSLASNLFRPRPTRTRTCKCK